MPVILVWFLVAVAPGAPADAPRLRTAALAGDWQAVQAMGRGALPEHCALAYDQVHLSPAQKLRLFEGLVHALEDPKPQVRQVALQALSILTHQTKGFQPNGSVQARSAAVEAWRQWIAEYRANL